MSRRAVVLVGLLVTVGILLASARFYTDVLWFRELEIASVLWTSLRTQFLVGLLVGLLTAAIVWINLAVARRLAPTYRSPRFELEGRRPDPLQQYRDNLGPFLGWIQLATSLFIGFLAGVAASTAWQTFLLWRNRVAFGIDDPQFDKDIGFYVFELPFFEQVADQIWFALMAALFTSVAAHYFLGSLRPELGWRGVASGALAHISVLLGALALVKAGQYLLGTYQLGFSTRGPVLGASYTDVNAHLPALRLLAVISVISAVLFLVTIWIRRLTLPLAAVGIWILTAFLAGTVWPALVQRFSVDPQEVQRERPFILRNLDATRAGFGLGAVTSDEFPSSLDLTPEEIAANDEVLQNVRLWDPSVLQQAYAQLQAIRTYYQFKDVDIDRYEIDGQQRQVLLSTRELSLDEIPERSKNWQNLHLQYTHGFGIVASLGNESTSAGQPEFLVRDIPGSAIDEADSLVADQPRIYYGEGFQANEYSIVNSDQEELDFALEEGGVERNRYDGEGGIEIGNLFQRLAFAVREGDPNLVLSGLINSDSKILIYRNIRDRVLRAAPFLDLDNDPYPAVVDGRLVWILDGYTSTAYYPYSERFDAGEFVDQAESGTLNGTVNYVRNSVKVVVDAYDGTMEFHIVDEDDPIIQAWRDAFPALFTDEAVTPELQSHFRFPEDLFALQTEVYRTYHMSDPVEFYQKEDEWDLPQVPQIEGLTNTGDVGSLIPPVYLLFRVPGETEQEFVLTRPFTPRNRDNMIAIMLGRSDPEHYGELVSLELPKSRQIAGPQQVDNLINQDTVISPVLSLLNQRGSQVQFGSLVILPIEDSLLYVQPVFVTAATEGIPELKKVALVLGEETVMGDSFEEALTGLFDLEEPTDEPSPSPSPTASPDEGEEPPDDEADVAELIARAARLYERAQTALQDGDFETYGRLIGQLGRVLERAEALSGR